MRRKKYIKEKVGARKLAPGRVFWLPVFLLLVTVLVGCSNPGTHPGPQQHTAGGTGPGDIPNSTIEQQGKKQPVPEKGDHQAAGPVKVFPAVVSKVVDGDTLHVKINGREDKVRLIGVNTPEIAHEGLGIKEQPYGKEAAVYTQKRLAGRQVYLELDAGERDKYGRLLAYVWLEQPNSTGEQEVRAKMYNAELLLNGYAQIMTVPPNVRYADLFVKLQREAREGGKGLWGTTAQSGPGS